MYLLDTNVSDERLRFILADFMDRADDQGSFGIEKSYEGGTRRQKVGPGCHISVDANLQGHALLPVTTICAVRLRATHARHN